VNLEVNKQKRKSYSKTIATIKHTILLRAYATNLPLPSVKSLIPPPTVSGTKTFSDV